MTNTETIGLCKSCKHWEKPQSEHGEVLGLGKCLAVVQLWDATKWEDDDDPGVDVCFRVLKNEYKEKMAFVQDGSDYYAALRTFADFGCVQYERGAG